MCPLFGGSTVLCVLFSELQGRRQPTSTPLVPTPSSRLSSARGTCVCVCTTDPHTLHPQLALNGLLYIYVAGCLVGCFCGSILIFSQSVRIVHIHLKTGIGYHCIAQAFRDKTLTLRH